MELSLNAARDMLAPLLENNKMLPRDIFDYKNEMHDNVSVHIRRCFPLIKEELLSFVKTPVSDIICFGPVCSSVYHSDSNINIAFVVDTKLPDHVLKYINVSMEKRGFVFKVYDHLLKFSILKPKDITFANWSVMYNRWNITPQFQNFKYDVDFLLAKYNDLNDAYHEYLDNLPKNENGIYTLESCEQIRLYFNDLERKAENALKNSPEHEYSLDYNLWLALDVFKVREHFKKEIVKSELYYLEEASDGKL